jgi:hypothetical protein
MQTMPNPARYHTTHNKTTVKKGCTMIPKKEKKNPNRRKKCKEIHAIQQKKGKKRNRNVIRCISRC